MGVLRGRRGGGGWDAPGPDDFGPSTSSAGVGKQQAAGVRQRGGAALLNAALGRLDAVGWRRAALHQRRWLDGAVRFAADNLRPKLDSCSPLPATCDHNRLERCANCVTSAPVALVGVHTMRARRTPAGRLWGVSLIAVGANSCGFHASSGAVRPHCRRLDYWTIAVASTAMLRCVYPNVPLAATIVSLAATPWAPFLVSTINTSSVEVKYLSRAAQEPSLRLPVLAHGVCCIAGLVCFKMEDLAPEVPLTHATWHCLSAAATATFNHLVNDVEEHELGLGAGDGRRRRHKP
ncbi:hypothetical protein FOA52_015943 [Chlamydomonas sp. UWO 241]|nr:hypothetical protein FOA52_015943 [Chlamydomonas sp. UWO 241]